MTQQLKASYRASLETPVQPGCKDGRRELYTHTQGRRQGLTPNFQSCPLTFTVACLCSHAQKHKHRYIMHTLYAYMCTKIF